MSYPRYGIILERKLISVFMSSLKLLISKRVFILSEVLNMLFTDSPHFAIYQWWRMSSSYRYFLMGFLFWLVKHASAMFLLITIDAVYLNNSLLWKDLGRMQSKITHWSGLKSIIQACFRRFTLVIILLWMDNHGQNLRSAGKPYWSSSMCSLASTMTSSSVCFMLSSFIVLIKFRSCLSEDEPNPRHLNNVLCRQFVYFFLAYWISPTGWILQNMLFSHNMWTHFLISVLGILTWPWNASTVMWICLIDHVVKLLKKWYIM